VRSVFPTLLITLVIFAIAIHRQGCGRRRREGHRQNRQGHRSRRRQNLPPWPSRGQKPASIQPIKLRIKLRVEAGDRVPINRLLRCEKLGGKPLFPSCPKATGTGSGLGSGSKS
jgi:hypothetical protein